MKVYLGHVYQPREEEIPTQLKDFVKSLEPYSSTMEEADVHIMYIQDYENHSAELTEEYAWIKENAKNVLALVPSNKYKRFAPKELEWQECYSIKSKRHLQMILERLAEDTWNPTERRQERFHHGRRGGGARRGRVEYTLTPVTDEGKDTTNPQSENPVGKVSQNIDVVIPQGVETVKLNLTFRMR